MNVIFCVAPNIFLTYFFFPFRANLVIKKVTPKSIERKYISDPSDNLVTIRSETMPIIRYIVVIQHNIAFRFQPNIRECMLLI